MAARLLDLLGQLPSVRAFIHSIAEDIRQRRSVMIFLPATIERAWVWSLLDSELWRRQLLAESVDLRHCAPDRTPVEILGEALHVKWPAASSREVASLAKSEGLPDVIVLEGIESLEPTLRNVWLRFIGQWAQVSQNLYESLAPPSVLCTLRQPGCLMSDHADDESLFESNSNVRLALHWWWGFPSALEVRLLLRLAKSRRTRDGQDPRWEEHLLPALAGNDVLLLERLWSANTIEEEQLLSCLHEFAQERGWTREKLREWGAVRPLRLNLRHNGSLPQSPPLNRRALWAQGALCATEEYGIELHPAALHVLGWHSELDRRLWRGQAELLLPVLDSVRRDVCSYLTSLYGRDWPVKWAKPEHPDEETAVRADPLACQWGYLEWLIRNCPQLERERRWLSLIMSAARVRNDIAHYRHVSQSQYEHVMEQYERFAHVAVTSADVGLLQDVGEADGDVLWN
jgi:hypothetical protein